MQLLNTAFFLEKRLGLCLQYRLCSLLLPSFKKFS
jgi:hypothetical protein